MIDGILGIDVSKDTLDASMSSCNKVRTRSFANSPTGWRHLLDWLITQRVRRVHACLESTGRYSLGIAGAVVFVRRNTPGSGLNRLELPGRACG